MSEEKQTVCGAISKVTSAQRDAERHHIVQVSFQEGIRGRSPFWKRRFSAMTSAEKAASQSTLHQEMRRIRRRSSSARTVRTHI